jgi:acyl-CoA thioester hydrolase
MATVFRQNFRVPYSLCTVGNHVYYARYLDILEAARGEFFRQLDASCQMLQEAGYTFPVIGVELSYLKPARYDDLLTVELWLTELTRVRLTFECRILGEHWETLVQGQTRHICASPEEKPKRMPKDLFARLEPFLAVQAGPKTPAAS